MNELQLYPYLKFAGWVTNYFNSSQLLYYIIMKYLLCLRNQGLVLEKNSKNRVPKPQNDEPQYQKPQDSDSAKNHSSPRMIHWPHPLELV